MKFLKRGFFQRLRGQCATAEPKDSGCWSYSEGEVRIEIARAPELSAPGGAIRLEGQGLPQRVLVMHCDDDRFRAVSNRCTHGGRRLDPVPGEGAVQCCSLGKSTFDYEGKVLHGPAKAAITPLAVASESDKLVIAVS
jgi:nitrite reductase/ring-hydroxylating ferredoxin subunit